MAEQVVSTEEELQDWLDAQPAPKPVPAKVPSWSEIQFNWKCHLYRKAIGQ